MDNIKMYNDLQRVLVDDDLWKLGTVLAVLVDDVSKACFGGDGFDCIVGEDIFERIMGRGMFDDPRNEYVTLPEDLALRNVIAREVLHQVVERVLLNSYLVQDREVK
jgi:hypothetical protein